MTRLSLSALALAISTPAAAKAVADAFNAAMDDSTMEDAS